MFALNRLRPVAVVDASAWLPWRELCGGRLGSAAQRLYAGFASAAAPRAKGGAELVASGGGDGASSAAARRSDAEAAPAADGSEVPAASASASGGSGGPDGEDTELDKINDRFHAIKTNTSFRVHGDLSYEVGMVGELQRRQDHALELMLAKARLEVRAAPQGKLLAELLEQEAR